MNRFFAIGAVAAATVALPSAAMAAPATTPTKVPLINDCGNGSINGDCMALDNLGTFAGVVKFRHKPNGNLRLMIVVKSAPANSSYQLEIYCGPTAARQGEMVGALADAVSTDQYGAALAGPFEVPAADLQDVCGSSSIGHLQLVNVPAGSILTAAPVRMTG